MARLLALQRGGRRSGVRHHNLEEGSTEPAPCPARIPRQPVEERGGGSDLAISANRHEIGAIRLFAGEVRATSYEHISTRKTRTGLDWGLLCFWYRHGG